jgi:hypothetical protein
MASPGAGLIGFGLPGADPRRWKRRGEWLAQGRASGTALQVFGGTGQNDPAARAPSSGNHFLARGPRRESMGTPWGEAT